MRIASQGWWATAVLLLLLLLTVELPAAWGLLVVLCPALADAVGDVTTLLQGDARRREVAPGLDLVGIAVGQENIARHSRAQE
jgi:hypothetical protein